MAASWLIVRVMQMAHAGPVRSMVQWLDNIGARRRRKLATCAN
jgi:hypothetical protein